MRFVFAWTAPSIDLFEYLLCSITALILLIASLVHPTHIPAGALCDVEAIITSTGVLTIHFWTITLAIVTYLGLTHPLGTTLVRVEHAWFGIGLAIYIIAAGVSVGVWALGGATYLNGYCEFVSGFTLFIVHFRMNNYSHIGRRSLDIRRSAQPHVKVHPLLHICILHLLTSLKGPPSWLSSFSFTSDFTYSCGTVVEACKSLSTTQ